MSYKTNKKVSNDFSKLYILNHDLHNKKNYKFKLNL